MPKDIAASIFNCILVRDPSWVDKYVVNHEAIHAAQQKEMLWIPFYIIYVIEFLAKTLWYRNINKAYMDISHEKEAYAHGADLQYLRTRKHFSQFRKKSISVDSQKNNKAT